MTDIDPRLGDVLNYISVKLPKFHSFDKNVYLYLNRERVEIMAMREVVLRQAAKAIGRTYP